MFKPDIIVCNPRDVLYPLWMWRMNKDRDLFGKIIVVMTQQAKRWNFTNYIGAAISRVEIIEEFEDDGSDWRNAAINEALNHSTSKTVLFLEQDFLVIDGFFQDAISSLKRVPALGFGGDERLHPAFLLVKRKDIEKTSRDFSVDKDVGDHFSKFTKEIEKLIECARLSQHEAFDYYHLAGLTQNYRLRANWHHPQVFNQYNQLSMKMKTHPMWTGFCREIDGKMGTLSDHGSVDLSKYFRGATCS